MLSLHLPHQLIYQLNLGYHFTAPKLCAFAEATGRDQIKAQVDSAQVEVDLPRVLSSLLLNLHLYAPQGKLQKVEGNSSFIIPSKKFRTKVVTP